ncbi:MAG: hypothetical protein O7B25_02800 [Gammaproteobacteria bacterium]|nr:hypothetical protein [Gammaproteobacteria bacterium]
MSATTSPDRPAAIAEVTDHHHRFGPHYRLLLSLSAEDEHDYKLACASTRQASLFNDPGYLHVARGYLTPRHP